MKFRMSHKGMTLPGLIVTMAVGSIITFAVMDMVVRLTKASVRVTNDQDFIGYMNIIQLNIRNQTNCQNTFAGTDYTPTKNAGGAEVPFQFVVANGPGNMDDLPFRVGDAVPGSNARIQSITIRDIASNLPPIPVNRSGVVENYQRALAEIKITAQAPVDNEMRSFKPVSFMVPFITTEAGIVQGCTTPNDGSVECTSSGGEWTGFECVPSNSCLHRGSFQRGGPGAFGNSLNGNAMACPSGFQEIQGGVVLESRKCGKRGVCTDTYPVIDCLKCGSMTAQLSPASPIVGLPTDPNSIDYSSMDGAVTNEINGLEANMQNLLNSINLYNSNY